MLKNKTKRDLIKKYREPKDDISPVQEILGSIFLNKITHREQYETYMNFLEDLSTNILPEIDNKAEVKEVINYIDLLSSIIEDYEKEKFNKDFKKSQPGEILQFIMDENQLKQKDLVKVLGSQSLVSDALNGKISLNKAKALGEYFKVDPTLFLDL